MLFRRSGSELFDTFKNIILLRIFPLYNIYSWKMLGKLKWQIPGEPLAVRYNWCQGPVLDRGPAAEKHWRSGPKRSARCWQSLRNAQKITVDKSRNFFQFRSRLSVHTPPMVSGRTIAQTVSQGLLINGEPRSMSCQSTWGWRWTKYESWNFNSGNYLFTTDTK